MWVRFTADFPFSPEVRGGRVTIAYKAGMTMNVTRECADKAIAAEKAVRTGSPRARDEANGDEE
jgi:hypothetical protein